MNSIPMLDHKFHTSWASLIWKRRALKSSMFSQHFIGRDSMSKDNNLEILVAGMRARRLEEFLRLVRTHPERCIINSDDHDAPYSQFQFVAVEDDFADVVQRHIQKDARMVDLNYVDLKMPEIRQHYNAEKQKGMEWVEYCYGKSEELKVFHVKNTNNKFLTVLARCQQSALQFAASYGHIHDRANGTVIMMSDDAVAELKASGQALGRALRANMPGVILTYPNHVLNINTGMAFHTISIVN